MSDSPMRDRFFHFLAVCTGEHPVRDSSRMFFALERAYSRQRYYHTFEHINECLDHLAWWQEQRSTAAPISESDICALELAIWYHDAVYAVGAADNEERSATLGAAAARRLGWSGERIDLVADLIRATAHLSQPPSVSPAGAGVRRTRVDLLNGLIVDIDLAILGSDSDRYTRYCNQVRTEYANLADDRFLAGRRRVLEHFLSLPYIYSTREFRGLLENRARKNLIGELDRLPGPSESRTI